MARLKSDARRDAIRSAAVRVIAMQGLGAPTATIAREAGVSNGSLFTYFDTKADLLNQLYVELKAEMGAAALDGAAVSEDIRDQMMEIWSRWLRWAVSCPDKRRTLAHLDVSDEITATSRQAAHHEMAGIAKLLEKSRKDGPMREVPLAFVVGLMSAMADTTSDFMIQDPTNADTYCSTAFEAMWRMLAGLYPRSAR